MANERPYEPVSVDESGMTRPTEIELTEVEKKEREEKIINDKRNKLARVDARLGNLRIDLLAPPNTPVNPQDLND